jgi:phosphatidate cytidylyltransferase
MSSWKDHQKRWITGVVGLILILFIIGYASKPIFFLFILLLNFLVLKEYYDLSSCKFNSRFLGIALGLTLTGVFFTLDKSALIGTMSGIVFFLVLFSILKFHGSGNTDTDLEKHLVGIFLISFLLSHLIWLRDLNQGKLWIFFLLSVVFTGDTFALYGGKFWGYHKLSPKISPGKTVEGTISGLVGSCLGGILFASFFFPHLSKIVLMPLSIILGIFGQIGDLWESVLKRKAMVKDSGWLLPGHGGFLDRMDSILFTAPFLYYFILLKEGSL